jgi:hypothetical protein
MFDCSGRPVVRRFELRSNAHLSDDEAVAKMGHPVVSDQALLLFV